ncbi:MAG: 6-phosphofructokinase [Pygmaiobacter sp.]
MHRGNIIIGQSGGPTSVINASLAGIYSAAKKAGVTTVYGMRYGIEGLLKGNVLDLDTVLTSDAQIELLCRTPSSFLGSCRYRLPDFETGLETYQTLFREFCRLDITACFYIGGNDSMDTIDKLSRYGASIGSPIRFIGAPKSIDNDLPCTDHTPGFGSAAKYIATLTKEIICDATVYDVKSVTVIEIMGRDAGWLTGASALCRGADCDGPDLIYLPELPFDLDRVIEEIRLKQQHKKALVLAVSEGIRTAEGVYVCEMAGAEKRQDVFGHSMLCGTAQFLAEVIGHRLSCKTRGIELNTPQRCAAHLLSATDVAESFRVGEGAFAAAAAGRTGEMAAFVRASNTPYTCEIATVPVGNVANAEQTVPRDFINAAGNDVTKRFIAYASPLIQGEVTSIWKDGLPVMLKR